MAPTPALPVSVADSETVTGLVYQPADHDTPPQAMDVLGACVSFLITWATVFTTVPLVARGWSQSRNALNSAGLIDGAGLSAPQLSHSLWKKKITHPPLLSACWT